MAIIRQHKRRIAILLSIALLGFIIFLSGFVWNPKTVTVVADGKNHIVKTHQASLHGIIEEAGITLKNGDTYTLSTKTLSDGTIITVERAFPVTITWNGKTKSINTTAKTAQALADQQGYKLPEFAVVGEPNQILKKGSHVVIERVTKQSTQVISRTIPIDTIREPDPQMIKGQEALVQTGSPGLERVKQDVYYHDNQLIQKRDVEVETITPMTPRIVKVGTRENIVETSRGAMRYTKVLTMNATAYTPAEGNGDGITASGLPAQRGVVAVDPDVIPLGTRLFIPGYGVAIAADTGGAIVGNRIDLLVDSKSEAFGFGRQDIEVYVLQ